MKTFSRTIVLGFVLTLFAWTAAAQSQPSNNDAAVRVRMIVNPDGSRTTYRFNEAEHKCTATTTGDDGKVREKMRYELDDAGRFASGRIFGADRKLRFKSRYKYDGAGRMEEEMQMNERGAVLHRIVYNYDQGGRATGYSVFNGNGKLENRVMTTTQSVAPKPHDKK